MTAFDSRSGSPAPGGSPPAPDPDDVRAARRLHELARHERDLGRLDRAESLALRALRQLDQVAGPGHPEVADVLGTLLTLRARGAPEPC